MKFDMEMKNMKKKLFVLFTILVLGFCLYAETYVNGDGNNLEGSASVPVTFNLSGSGEDATVYWEIGFTSDPSVTAENSVKRLTEVPLTYGTGENAANGVPEGNVGVYWILKGNPKVNITLKADTAMKGTTNEANKINWKVSWDSDNKSSGTDVIYSEAEDVSSYSPQDVYTSTDDQKTIETGVMPLNIVTQDVTDAASDNYSANLVLSISDQGE